MPTIYKTYNLSVKVIKEDIDSLLHVNNLSYLKWVLKAAEEHWNNISTKEMKINYLWVVLRHEIDYLRPAFINENLLVKTWIEDNNGAKSERVVEIYNQNDTLIVKAKTTWCLIDRKTKRPKRIPKEIIKAFC